MDNTELTLVTGATGNLGNAIVRQLLANNRKVRCLVRNIEREKTVLPPNVELVQGDLTDKASIEKAMKGVTSIFHAGGLPEQWFKDESIFEKVNTLGTQYLIEAALNEKVNRFIYTSTQDVFDLRQVEFDETTAHPRIHISAYERSKILAQDLIDKAVTENGLPAISLHPVAIYGPCVAKPTGMTRLIEDLMNNKVPVILKGGFPVIFNEDAARAHILAEQKSTIGEKYILVDKYYTLQEIAQKVSEIFPSAKQPKLMPDIVANAIAFISEPISKLTGKPPLITKGELSVLRRKGKPNGMKIKTTLGWETTSFEEGLGLTIKSLNLKK
ncbi:MAG: NAD-dependent epimerase/dehydratase family protein [Cryomorphaceae bacterium]|nr:NAD-dependent epimerase/dehydratase family protein [Cryomorphaceae bacterium]